MSADFKDRNSNPLFESPKKNNNLLKEVGQSSEVFRIYNFAT